MLSNSPSRGFLAAYLLHLLAPLYLVLDVLFGHWFRGYIGLTPTASLWASIGPVGQGVLFIGVLWLIAGLAVLFFGLMRPDFKWSLLQGPLTGVYGLLVALAMVELLLQLAAGGAADPALWPKGRDALLQPDPASMPGVSGMARFTGNDVGLRGTTFPVEDDVYKIITVGGSTTKDLYLDDLETWSNLLMNGLNEAQDGATVWVGNAGQSGRNTVDHLALLQSLPVLGQVDLLVFLIGINDFGAVVSYGGASTQEALEANAAEFKQQILNGGGRVRPTRPYYKRSQLYDLVRSAALPQVADLVPAGVLGRVGVGPGSFLEDVRSQRAGGKEAPLPSMTLGLEEYSSRISSLAAECRSLGVRCFFMTQPSMYREEMTPTEEALLWAGWVQQEDGTLGYVSYAELAGAIRSFNDSLLSVCQQEGLECFDLDREIPKDTNAFFDDVHFNESGARLVAGALSRELIERGYLN